MMKFGKLDTNIAKSIAIIMMYIHHLFFGTETYMGYTFSFAPFGESRTIAIAQLCKVCVSIFVFLTAYGITISFMKKEEKNSEVPLKEFLVEDFCRWIKLISGFIVIYILAQVFSFLGRNNTEVYGTGIKSCKDAQFVSRKSIPACGKSHVGNSCSLCSFYFPP